MLNIALAALALSLQDAEPPADALSPVEQSVATLTGLISEGQVGSSEFQAALAAIRSAAEAGDPEAMNAMGGLSQAGYAEGPAAAEAWFRQAMASEDADEAARATFNLAGFLFTQPGRIEEARSLLESIAETSPDDIRGNVLGYLGYLLITGQGGELDIEYGSALINSAIARQFRDAGVFEAYGIVLLESDVMRAQSMFENSARLGNASAAWRAAMLMLEAGDLETAYNFVAWSSEQGYLNAQISRAVMLASGQGVEVDAAAAREWYMTAIRQGSAHALRAMGAMLVTGEGGPADVAAGYALLDVAAAAGDPVASQLIEDLPDEGYRRPRNRTVEAAGEAWFSENELDPASFS